MEHAVAPGRLELRASQLKVAYGRHVALEIADLHAQGRIVAIIGHNGSGKSTMLKSLLQLLMPRTGSIESSWVHGEERLTLVPERHMAFSPENGAVFEDVSVESYVRLWCRIKHADANFYKKAGSRYIEKLNITPLLSKFGRELSKGQRRRVMAVVGFLIHPKLFLFDEPFDGLDIMQSAELASIMLEESRQMSMVVSSHRMDVVERIADTVIVLRDGKVHASGDVEEVCATLCGGSMLISAANGHHVSLESVLPDLQREFYSCMIHQSGRQLLITGNDINVESLKSFFHRSALPDIRMDPVRPSLMDAMRYHLHQVH